MTIGGAQQYLNVQNNVYDASPLVLAWVAMTQPLVSTDTLTVAGTMSVTNFPATSPYKLSGLDSSGDPAYFGYLDPDGNWYIMQVSISAGTSLYAKGASGFAAAWVDKVIQSYDYYNAVF
jgi:hypothetical protein